MEIILPTEEEINKYEMLVKLFNAQQEEFIKLSAKKPLDQLNEIKIDILNKVLIPLKSILKNEDVYDFLPDINEDNMPNNSDVVIILSQYDSGLKSFRRKYYINDPEQSDPGHKVNRWNTKENPIKRSR